MGSQISIAKGGGGQSVHCERGPAVGGGGTPNKDEGERKEAAINWC